MENVEQAPAAWLLWVLPSFTDLFFLVFLGLLGFSPLSAGLLRDADTGVHIRNGEQILATHAITRTDSFSYTRQGEPWYAWEWLYDVVIAAIHHVSGLNGVMLFTAGIISITFALLFQFILRRSGNLAVAAFLTLSAAAAAQVHMLARPHILSWLFTVLWADCLYRFDDGERSMLPLLPLLMLLWVNLHGGFILGLGLLGIFAVANIWDALATPREGDREKIGALSTVFLLCLLATLLTPYGYKLHIHVYQYLSNSVLMNNIDEFLSPNFHLAPFRYFELFLLIVMAVVAFGRREITTTSLLLLLFSLHAGLYAARNIPISVALMSLALGRRPATQAVQSRRQIPSWLESTIAAGRGISESMAQLEPQLRGHGLVFLVVAACLALAGNDGRVFSKQILRAHFDENIFPEKAARFIAQQGIRDHLFSSDVWGAYLIYRLYPRTKVYFDDRHDFYGEAFVRGYGEANLGTRRWRSPLDRYQVKWVLMPVDSTLATLLRESPDWGVEYDDGLAMLFLRTGAPGQ
jgi:hypothetical protein